MNLKLFRARPFIGVVPLALLALILAGCGTPPIQQPVNPPLTDRPSPRQASDGANVQGYIYVGGQINQTNAVKLPYTGRITVLGAIGAAGGFNQFAARTRIQLTRKEGTVQIVDCKKALKDPALDYQVFPGDKIFVDQQTFGGGLMGR